MSDEAKADIAVQLIALATYAESANHWTDEERLMGAAGVADTIYDAIDRIAELEAKLAKARSDAINEFAANAGMSLTDHVKALPDDVRHFRMQSARAELKGTAL